MIEVKLGTHILTSERVAVKAQFLQDSRLVLPEHVLDICFYNARFWFTLSAAGLLRSSQDFRSTAFAHLPIELPQQLCILLQLYT